MSLSPKDGEKEEKEEKSFFLNVRKGEHLS